MNSLVTEYSHEIDGVSCDPLSCKSDKEDGSRIYMPKYSLAE